MVVAVAASEEVQEVASVEVMVPHTVHVVALEAQEGQEVSLPEEGRHISTEALQITDHRPVTEAATEEDEVGAPTHTEHSRLDGLHIDNPSACHKHDTDGATYTQERTARLVIAWRSM